MDNRTKNRKIGDLGESLVCKFLVKRGFEIVERNYLRKWGEIDIIARKGEKLHFVEVKSVSHLPVSYACPPVSSGRRQETDGYRPEDNLHPWKLKRLSRVIQTYLLGYKPSFVKATAGRGVTCETNWQFDVAVVYLDFKGLQAKINYLEDIVL